MEEQLSWERGAWDVDGVVPWGLQGGSVLAAVAAAHLEEAHFLDSYPFPKTTV